jgi:glycerophosphoryl diester phosphodiesterase
MHVLSRLAGAAGTLAVALSVAAPAHAGPSAPTDPGRQEVLTVAHRGASAYAPENTLAAARLGIEMRADLVEVDVQRSSDGALVLFHDTTLARTTDAEEVFPGRAPWRLADFTLAELRQLDAGSWKAPEYAGERIPTLREALAVIRPSRSGLLLELKSPALYPGIEAEIAAAMRAVPGYVESSVRNGRLVVQSFDFASMETYAALEPDVPIGLLGRPAPALLSELATYADQVNPNHRLIDAEYVDAVHDAGLDMLVYTVNEVADMQRSVALGVDGVITDRPDVLERVLREAARPAA